MFEWSDAYRVHVRSIDAQHQNLFALARELHAAIAAGRGRAVTAKVLDRLVQYTNVHFAYEERLLEQHNYPQLNEHRAEHTKLTARVVRFQDEFLAGRTTMTVEILRFLRDWLEKHIKEIDIQYAPYLRGSAEV